MFELAPATETDRYFDYCLEPYRPRRPWKGKLRSENLLFHSLTVGGAQDALTEPLRAIQGHVGRDLTVWGIKWDGAALFWELYFYDPQKEAPEATLSSITKAMAPYFTITPAIDEATPYVMASFDVRAENRGGSVDTVNLYLTGEEAHAGRSYSVSRGRSELENTYRFMPPKTEIDEVLSLLEASVFVDYKDPRTLSRVLIPELFACKKICVSKKRDRDAIYFSGIDVDQLLFFFERFSYPDELVGFVREQKESFEHLYFDVGVDYRRGPDGALEYPKTSYYGTL
ncbi:MAG: hypothetical protein DRJ42_16765 [Deltaproteobacteria bacterium]|nr:MAG: hypothetical protein DRJ42_16765 [Deltaproteobacteria bacterium]